MYLLLFLWFLCQSFFYTVCINPSFLSNKKIIQNCMFLPNPSNHRKIFKSNCKITDTQLIHIDRWAVWGERRDHLSYCMYITPISTIGELAVQKINFELGDLVFYCFVRFSIFFSDFFSFPQHFWIQDCFFGNDKNSCSLYYVFENSIQLFFVPA